MNRANDPLEKAKEILRVFLEDFEEVRQHISPPASYWEKDDAYTWIYADRRYPPLMHRMGRTRALPSFYSQPLQPLFDKWLAKVLDVQNIPTYRIPDPLDSEKVHAYLERLQSIVRDEKERRKIWWHSLRSFTRFLRDEARNQIEVLGELDVIFPEDMTIHFDMIIRKVPITLYPIDVWAAADLKCLERNEVTFDSPIWERKGIESDICEDLFLVASRLPNLSREERTKLDESNYSFLDLTLLLKRHGYATALEISKKLIEIYSGENQELEEKIEALKSKKTLNLTADKTIALMGIVPAEDNLDKILKYERAIQKSIFQNLFLLKSFRNRLNPTKHSIEQKMGWITELALFWKKQTFRLVLELVTAFFPD